jgi:hypothetical protein
MARLLEAGAREESSGARWVRKTQKHSAEKVTPGVRPYTGRAMSRNGKSEMSWLENPVV